MHSTHPLITINPQRRGGRACIRDLRISVGDVLGWLAQGMTVSEILADYPELTQADVLACLLAEGAVAARRGQPVALETSGNALGSRSESTARSISSKGQKRWFTAGRRRSSGEGAVTGLHI